MPRVAITVMGSFVADLGFRTSRLPAWGETVLGTAFSVGPGGKGSNQAVAAARLGGQVGLICKLGRDAFGDLARRTYHDERINMEFSVETTDQPTGAAAVIVHGGTGDNAIVVVPGAGFQLTTAEVDRAAPLVARSSVFLTQLELPIDVVEHGLALAHRLGVMTILNPAPALVLPDRVYALCDYLTPNEGEAAALAGRPVVSLADAECAADILLARGARHVVITLGARGALVKGRHLAQHVPAMQVDPVIDTTGAGDAFNGGLAIGLAEGLDAVAATRFGCAVAGLSVTRHGTSISMPSRADVDALVASGGGPPFGMNG